MNVCKKHSRGLGSSMRPMLVRASPHSVVELDEDGEEGHAPSRSRSGRGALPSLSRGKGQVLKEGNSDQVSYIHNASQFDETNNYNPSCFLFHVPGLRDVQVLD